MEVFRSIVPDTYRAIRFASAARNNPFITAEGAISGAEYTEAIPAESQLITLSYYDGIYLTDEDGTRKRWFDLDYVPEAAEFFHVDKHLGRNVYENTWGSCKILIL